MKIDKPIYAPSGKYKLALNDKGDITFINTVPSDKVDIVYTEPLTEYLAPEAFVSQNGVQALVDPETGEYTFTPQSVAIVNEEHHRPLNPHARYMQQKGVAPKDNEVEHLMTRYRADQAGERADLTPFFANLMTGGYAEAAKRGWEDIKNKKYFTGGTEILSPLMFGENYWNNLAQGLYGGVHLLNDNGIPKTWREIKEGNYGNAALSGMGDTFNLLLTIPGFAKTLNGIQSSQPRINNVRGIEGRPKTWEEVVQQIKQGKDDFISEIESDIYKAVAEANKTEAEQMGLAYIPTYEKPAFISTKDGINFKLENLSPTEAANWNSASRTVTINKRLPENVSLRNAVAHEVTHAGEHGTPDSSLLQKALKIAEEKGIPLKDVPEYQQLKKQLEYLRFKSGQIFKPGSDYAGKFDLSEHGGEAVANARDFGKEIGVKFGEEYPGYEEAYRRIMSNIDGSKSGLYQYFKLDEEHMPYVWNSLNGTHFFTGTQETLPGVKFRGIIPKGEGNPLDVRLQRMMLRSKLKQENPEIYNLIYDENNPFILPDQSISIVPKVRYDNVRKAMLDIDPSLSDVDLDMGIQIALANKKGVHFDLGNKSGDTIGGVNIVEIADAVNMVRKLHGREAIPYDISMIAGHELGHGVQLSDDALRAVSGYYDPYEFYTQAGQVLDNAGIINNTLSPLSFNKFINLTNNYLANGNLDNGITKMRDFLMSLSPLERQAVMKNINRFSAGLFGAYLIGKGINNGKVQS